MICGEVGLGGEIRAVSQLEARLAESARLGFTQAWIPRRSGDLKPPKGLACTPLSGLVDLMDGLF